MGTCYIAQGAQLGAVMTLTGGVRRGWEGGSRGGAIHIHIANSLLCIEGHFEKGIWYVVKIF